MTQKNDKSSYKPLTPTELTRLTALYSKMSPAAKQAFIVMLLMKYEDNFEEIIIFLGELYERTVPRA